MARSYGKGPGSELGQELDRKRWGDAQEIVPRTPDGDEAGGSQQTLDRAELTDPELEHEDALGRQQVPGGRGNRPVGIKTVGSSVERKSRIEHAHLGRQRGNVVTRHIGRIRYHDVERSF